MLENLKWCELESHSELNQNWSELIGWTRKFNEYPIGTHKAFKPRLAKDKHKLLKRKLTQSSTGNPSSSQGFPNAALTATTKKS